MAGWKGQAEIAVDFAQFLRFEMEHSTDSYVRLHKNIVEAIIEEIERLRGEQSWTMGNANADRT